MARLVLMSCACLSIFLFITIPWILRLPFEKKKPWAAAGVGLYYLFSAVLFILDRSRGSDILTAELGGRPFVVCSSLDRKTGDYALTWERETLLRSSIGRYFDTNGYLVRKNLDEDLKEVADSLRHFAAAEGQEASDMQESETHASADLGTRVSQPAAEPAQEGKAP